MTSVLQVGVPKIQITQAKACLLLSPHGGARLGWNVAS